MICDLQLVDLLQQDVALAGIALLPRREDLLLVGQHRVDQRVAAAGFEVGRELDPIGMGLLGQQPGLAGDQQVALVLQRIAPARRRRAVEADQDLAGLDPIALAHQQVLDDAALEMLHRLVVALGADVAVGDGGAGQRHEARPRRRSRRRTGRSPRPPTIRKRPIGGCGGAVGSAGGTGAGSRAGRPASVPTGRLAVGSMRVYSPPAAARRSTCGRSAGSHPRHAGRARDLLHDLVAPAQRFDGAVAQDQDPVDMRQHARPMRDQHDRGALRLDLGDAPG